MLNEEQISFWLFMSIFGLFSILKTRRRNKEAKTKKETTPNRLSASCDENPLNYVASKSTAADAVPLKYAPSSNVFTIVVDDNSNNHMSCDNNNHECETESCFQKNEGRIDAKPSPPPPPPPSDKEIREKVDRYRESRSDVRSSIRSSSHVL